LVATHFNIQEHTDITTCLEAKLSPAGSCQKGDFAFLKETGLKLCQVWLHVAIGPDVYSMVSTWELLELGSIGCHGIFAQAEGAYFDETSNLACAVAHMQFKKQTGQSHHLHAEWVMGDLLQPKGFLQKMCKKKLKRVSVQLCVAKGDVLKVFG